MNTNLETYTPGEWFEAKSRDDLAAFFAHRLPAIREAAQAHGYAIGVHGSMRRDLDLIATPWRDGAADKDTLAHAIAEAACGISRHGAYDWEAKPLGRMATSIPCCWATWHDEPGTGHIDLSVTPVTQQVRTEPIGVEAVAEVKHNKHGFGYIDWLIEGGIAALPEGTVMVVPHKPITGDDGQGEVYTASQATTE